MAMDYAKCAQEIYSHLGGRENLVSAAHCATRLRLVTVDNSKIDQKALENVDGVKGVFSSNGQLQLILGTGVVNKVYDEFLAVTGMTAATKDEVKAAAAKNQPLPQRMVKALGDVFVPILPAIVASGLMMGLVEALGHAIPSFAASDWYGFLDLVSATAFAYLPVLIAISAAVHDPLQSHQCLGGSGDGDGSHVASALFRRPAGRLPGPCYSGHHRHMADVLS